MAKAKADELLWIEEDDAANNGGVSVFRKRGARLTRAPIEIRIGDGRQWWVTSDQAVAIARELLAASRKPLDVACAGCSALCDHEGEGS